MRSLVFCLVLIYSVDMVIEEKMSDITAAVGENVTLSCEGATMNQGTFEWTRSDLVPPYIYVVQDNFESNDGQNHNYSKRTAVFKQQFKHKNYSLQLLGAKESDTGDYRCSTFSNSSVLPLSVIRLIVRPADGPMKKTTENGNGKSPPDTWGIPVGVVIVVVVLLVCGVGLACSRCKIWRKSRGKLSKQILEKKSRNNKPGEEAPPPLLTEMDGKMDQ
ncbi:uncharacterized protein LOC130130879 [Lampris incognitus]|uniref:uncharacterized protein LOC130130879 n=1 Tax=Lampris incognitus TaxID=2546036 RepID=UPI0024B51E10|nr:uncharacterized protein LOC130130879 [Lampris incognitus]